MKTTQYNKEPTVTVESLTHSSINKVLTSDRVRSFIVTRFIRLNKNAYTEKNINETITSMSLIILHMKAHESYKKTIIKTYKNNPEKVKNYFVKDESKLSIYVPRPKDKNYIQDKITDPDFYIREFEKFGIHNYMNFTIAQDIINNLDIGALVIGGLTPDNEKIISEITIKPFEQWNKEFIKLIPSEYKLQIAFTYGKKEYAESYKSIFGDLEENNTKSLIKLSNGRYVPFTSDHANEINNHNKKFSFTKYVHYYNRKYERVNDVTHTTGTGRMYSSITHMGRNIRECIMESEDFVELDQTASKINKLYIINTGKPFDSYKHPVKEFISYLLNSYKITDTDIQKYFYTILKPIVISAFNNPSFEYSLEKSLIELGLCNSPEDKYYAGKQYYNSKDKVDSYVSKSNAMLMQSDLRDTRKQAFIKSFKNNSKLLKHDYKFYYAVSKKLQDYTGNINISVDKFITALEKFFNPVKNYLYKFNWYIDEEIDYNYSKLILKFCIKHNIPYITIFDAFYVPKRLLDIAQEFMNIATIQSVQNFKLQYNSDREYSKVLDSSYIKFSKNEIYNNLHEDCTRFRKILTSIYVTNFYNSRTISKKMNLQLLNFKTNDIYFNKLLEVNPYKYKKFITDYVNSISSLELVSLVLLYETNSRIINLNLNSLCKYVYNDKLISTIRLQKFMVSNQIKYKFFDKSINTKIYNTFNSTEFITKIVSEFQNSIIKFSKLNLSNVNFHYKYNSKPMPLFNMGGIHTTYTNTITDTS